MKPTISEWITVKKSKIHGEGIFAAKNIPKGAKIIEYVGKKLTKKESDERYEKHQELAKSNPKLVGSVYIFELNKKFDIDGFVPYNTARLINHGCKPNCESDIANDKIWITALRDIKKGEEISYDYGYDLESWEEHPCKCGSANCVGYIVDSEHWGKLKKMIRAKRELSNNLQLHA